MSVNLYRPHVLVLPEDDANRQLANGFLNEPALNLRAIQVLPVAGGWAKVRDEAMRSHFSKLQNYPMRHLVLLVDFDGHFEERIAHFQAMIPAELSERIYLLGVADEPESLRTAQGVSLERIGERLASACTRDEPGLWSDPLLRHNLPELDRLIGSVKPFLFIH